MAKLYKLTQPEVQSSYELGTSMVLALLLKLALDVQKDREAAANEIEQGVQQLIEARTLPDIPPQRQDEYRRAANDRALQIVNHARHMRRHKGPRHMQ